MKLRLFLVPPTPWILTAALSLGVQNCSVESGTTTLNPVKTIPVEINPAEISPDLHSSPIDHSISHQLNQGDQTMSTTGIEGEVRIAPISPVSRSGAERDRPHVASITILNETGETVTQIKSDAEGHFHLGLPPGTYTLRPEVSSARPYVKAQVVTVTEAGYTPVRIEYDSGIR